MPELDTAEIAAQKKFDAEKKKMANEKKKSKGVGMDVGAESDDDSDNEADETAIKAAMDSVDPKNNPDVAASQERKQHKNSMNLMQNRIKLTKEERDKRGVIYVGHIPVGFCEPQMKKFFSQFGKVTRMILKRSLKTGRPKGYAFIEFELEQIAEIVAGAMDKYIMFDRTLEIRKIPQGAVPPGVFKNCYKKIVVTERKNQKRAKKQHNKVLKGDDKSKKYKELSSRQTQRRNRGAVKQKAVLAEMGLAHLATAALSKRGDTNEKAVSATSTSGIGGTAKSAKKSKVKKKIKA